MPVSTSGWRASTTDRPTTASTTWTHRPSCAPQAAAVPARRLRVAERRTTVKSGPGSAYAAATTAMNAHQSTPPTCQAP